MDCLLRTSDLGTVMSVSRHRFLHARQMVVTFDSVNEMMNPKTGWGKKKFLDY